jgi:hypothetical protein
MNNNAKRWVAALRSGQYRQGPFLHNVSDNTHSALGIACLLYQQEVGDLVEGNEQGYSGKVTCRTYEGYFVTLPHEVKEWLGLTYPDCSYCNERGIAKTLVKDNEELGFAQIADLIESEPKEMFSA